MLLSSGRPGAYVVHHQPELTVAERTRIIGQARVHCAGAVVAGESIAVAFDLTIGECNLPAGGRIAIAWAWPLDFGDLQITDPDAPNHLIAAVDTPDTALDARYYSVSLFNPWNHAIELTVRNGSLSQRSQVRITCTHWQAPTCAASAACFLVVAQAKAGLNWTRLVDPEPIAVYPGPPAELSVVSPSDTTINQEATVVVRCTDRFGNPTAPPISPELYLKEGSPAAHIDAAQHTQFAGAWRIPVRFYTAGRAVMQSRAGELTAASNPIQVHDSEPANQLLWGDLHAGQGNTGCGLGSLDHHFAFARDVAGLQFASQQANDHYVTAELWKEVKLVTERWHQDGRFAAFLGCEWSALTVDGGDRNLIFSDLRAELPRSARFFAEQPSDPTPDAPQAENLHRSLAGQKVLINLHAGGRPTNLNYHDADLERLFEVHSTHGTSDWFVIDAIRRGYRVGITAGTDGVMGRPGACHPGRRLARNCRGGVTGLYATKITRSAIWEAFQQRCCYGTTGERIRLWVEINGTPMGGQTQLNANAPVRMSVTVDGTAAIEKIELLRGTEVVTTAQVAAVDPHRLRILWGGTQACGTAREQRVMWNGSLTVENAVIGQADPIRFESPYDGLDIDGATVRWRSATAGGDAGLVLSLLDCNSRARCHFASEPTSFSFAPAAVMATPTRVPAGGLDRHVDIGPMPCDDGPPEAEVELTDPSPPSLTSPVPYWVRVTQIDRARAWSSPIEVSRATV